MKQTTELITTKLTLIVVGLTAGSGLLIPATYASFHPVTSGEIEDNTIQSVDILDGTIASVDIKNSEVKGADIASNAVNTADISDTNGVKSVDIVNGEVKTEDLASGAIQLNIHSVKGDGVPGGIPPGDSGADSVECPSGETRTGGGFIAGPNVRVYYNYPQSVNSWYVAGFNQGASSNSLYAYVLCARPSP